MEKGPHPFDVGLAISPEGFLLARSTAARVEAVGHAERHDRIGLQRLKIASVFRNLRREVCLHIRIGRNIPAHSSVHAHRKPGQEASVRFAVGAPMKAAPISNGNEKCLPLRGIMLPQPVVMVNAGFCECMPTNPLPLTGSVEDA